MMQILHNEVKKLELLNPLNVKVQNYLSPENEIKKTTNILLIPEIPAIVVEGTKGQGIEELAYVYVIAFILSLLVIKLGIVIQGNTITMLRQRKENCLATVELEWLWILKL
ncbi:hypothetical protein NDK43_11010 [Neobacillus pocheonensis]|uniref:Uncharacterized protein n=1 Tax=Neobacillus pocheonensis TaxID=363869 RepID=A0ABT0WB63_9BACI|nr:hypothetical protein [Neobacillus pocheonensis]